MVETRITNLVVARVPVTIKGKYSMAFEASRQATLTINIETFEGAIRRLKCRTNRKIISHRGMKTIGRDDRWVLMAIQARLRQQMLIMNRRDQLCETGMSALKNIVLRLGAGRKIRRASNNCPGRLMIKEYHVLMVSSPPSYRGTRVRRIQSVRNQGNQVSL